MSYNRTPEHRAQQAERIKKWSPWEKSTGPKSQEGKNKAALRGYKGATRPIIRNIARILRSQKKFLCEVALDSIKDFRVS